MEVASLPGHRKSRQVGDAIYGLKIHARVAIKAKGGDPGDPTGTVGAQATQAVAVDLGQRT